ncbi:MAG: DUF1036 domain-containing protein [Pseudomonadota bacterium]
MEICNATGQAQSVAIAQNVEGAWTSQGWWNIEDGACVEPIEGALLNRYYFYRAEVPGGVFDHEGYAFCVSGRMFTISEHVACRARGYDTAGFARIDTGDTATHFKLTLVPPP